LVSSLGQVETGQCSVFRKQSLEAKGDAEVGIANIFGENAFADPRDRR